MKKVIITFLMLTFILTGCATEPTELVANSNASTSGYNELIKNELYYIQHAGSNFATKYKEFTLSNPELEVFDVEILPNTGTHNGIDGYYIFTKKVK